MMLLSETDSLKGRTFVIFLMLAEFSYFMGNIYCFFLDIQRLNMTSKVRTHGKVSFNESWLTDERFKLWIKKGPDSNKAACSLCNNAVIDIAKMRVSTLSSHTKGTKHQERARNYYPTATLFFQREKTNPPSTSSDTAKAINGKIDTMMNSVAVSHTEIRSDMKVVTSHFSCLNINSLLASMFPDSQIAKSFQLSKTKCAYYTLYGLAPYYKEALLQTINSSPAHSILFDESFNHQLQDEQLDGQVCFWDNESRLKHVTLILTSLNGLMQITSLMNYFIQ